MYLHLIPYRNIEEIRVTRIRHLILVIFYIHLNDFEKIKSKVSNLCNIFISASKTSLQVHSARLYLLYIFIFICLEIFFEKRALFVFICLDIEHCSNFFNIFFTTLDIEQIITVYLREIMDLEHFSFVNWWVKDGLRTIQFSI